MKTQDLRNHASILQFWFYEGDSQQADLYGFAECISRIDMLQKAANRPAVRITTGAHWEWKRDRLYTYSASDFAIDTLEAIQTGTIFALSLRPS